MKIHFENWKYPIFDGSQLSCVTWYHKILSAYLLGCKSLLISTWKPVNFHNRHHINMYYLKGESDQILIWMLLAVGHEEIAGPDIILA